MGETGDGHRGWFVHLSVSAEDGQALLGVDPQNYPDGGARLVTSAVSDRKEFVLYSREIDAERARDAVAHTYQRLRRTAGLAADPALIISLDQATGRRRSGNRLDVTLMRAARRALEVESNFEWAVVLAQTACEVYARDILKRKAETLDNAARERVERVSSTNLASETVRREFQDMTGYAPPAEADWWRSYLTHATRRHKIVHEGARVTRKEAKDSLAAATAMIGFLHWPSQSIDAERM